MGTGQSMKWLWVVLIVVKEADRTLRRVSEKAWLGRWPLPWDFSTERGGAKHWRQRRSVWNAPVPVTAGTKWASPKYIIQVHCNYVMVIASKKKKVERSLETHPDNAFSVPWCVMCVCSSSFCFSASSFSACHHAAASPECQCLNEAAALDPGKQKRGLPW